MEEPDGLEAFEESEGQTFTWPLLGALYGSLVIVAVVAVLESRLGRNFGAVAFALDHAD